MRNVIFRKIMGVLLILSGIILYITPIPATSLLIVLGFVFIIGKDKTLIFLKKIFSHKMFKKLRIKDIIEKIS